MTLTACILIWLAAILYASGCLDNLPQRALTFARWARLALTTNSHDRASRTSPRFNLMRARGKADRNPPAVGSTFWIDTDPPDWRFPA